MSADGALNPLSKDWGVMRLYAIALSLVFLAGAGPAAAQQWTTGGKLLLTGGVSSVEGSGGGGLASWATITGGGAGPASLGANVHVTGVVSQDYELRSAGVAVGLGDRFELSYARHVFDTGATGGKLGLGAGFAFEQDVVGAKLRLIGDAVYDQDTWLPQIAAGVQWKRNDQGAIVRAVGGRDHEGVDVYLAATKILLNESLVLSGAARATKANQLGLLGFGGDKDDDYSLQFEGSAGVLLNRRLLVGAEYRSKPDNLGFAKEDDWVDVFAAYAINKNLSVTAAYADLGDIATFKDQRGLYLSIQAGF
ncbi:MAG: DUF3034 family protein [Caulobacteraceae bacterium]|nr:DUF3034 family protein [Caulobacteraceae bacterium]